MRRSLSWIARAISGTIHGENVLGDEVFVDGFVVTDSREATAGSLYFARKGENADGHRFIDAATRNGAVAAVVEEYCPEFDVPQILVADATTALGELACAYLDDLRRLHPQLRVLAVTGSAGKTTTKDLTFQLLSTLGPTVAPKLSYNNEVGLPLTVLKADEDTEYLVLEMGASGPRHITYLTNIAAPDIAIELMVGHAHMGGFGSVEGIAAAKAELLTGMRTSDGNVSILNVDDPLVMGMASKAKGRILTFSATGNEVATVRATNVHIDEIGRASFTVTSTWGQETQSAQVKLGLVGRHHVSNALAAICAGLSVGMNLSDIAPVITGNVALSPHRMDVRDLVIEGKNVTLIDDSYNANIDSMRAAIHATEQIAAGRPVIAVIGQMLELGDESVAMHLEVGRLLDGIGIQHVITVGAEAQIVRDGLGNATHAVHAQEFTEVFDILSTLISDDCVLLIKGSNGSHVHLVADEVIEKGSVR